MANLTNIAGTTSGNNTQLTNVVLDVFSKEILFQAQPNLRFKQLATVKQDLTVLPGQRIKFLKYNSITGSAALTETNPIETGVISTATLQITVGEHGKALAFSQALLNASVTDLLSDAAKMLGMHYAVYEDGMIRDMLLTSANVLYAKFRTSRAGLVATDVYDIDLVREVIELLATNKAPKTTSGDYITVVHPHQAKSIRKDSAWVNLALYKDPEMVVAGEIGKIEDMRFIETSMITYIKKTTQDIWADNADTGVNTGLPANAATDVYQAISVGDFAVGYATALPVEMRDDGVTDFGRTHKLAWYSIFGVGLLELGHTVIEETA